MFALLLLIILFVCLVFVDIYSPPRVIEGVLTDEEIDIIFKEASDKFVTSKTIGGDSQNIRRSKQVFLENTPETLKIINKVKRLVNMEHSDNERIQVVKYEPGDYYRPHQDTCCFGGNREGCQGADKRRLTVIVYMNDDFEGGGTNFPNLNMYLKPKKGDAIVFNTLGMFNRCSRYALHEGTPVKSGTKYISTFWIR